MRDSRAFQYGLSLSTALVLRDAERNFGSPALQRLQNELRIYVTPIELLLLLKTVNVPWAQVAETIQHRIEPELQAAPAAAPPFRLGRAGGQLEGALRLAVIRDQLSVDVAGDLGLGSALGELEALVAEPGVSSSVADKARELLGAARGSGEPAMRIDAVTRALRDKYILQARPAAPPAESAPTPEELRVLDDILQHPDLPAYTLEQDNVLRAKVAELMRARHAPQGELIEAQLLVFRSHQSQYEQNQLQMEGRLGRAFTRVDELIREHGARWAAAVKPLIGTYRFRRGFIGEVELTADQFLSNAAELYRRAPVTMVKITSGARERIEELARSPHLARIRALDLMLQDLGDDELEVLARSPNVANLMALNLRSNRIGEIGVWKLAESRSFRSLAVVELFGNPADPTSREVRSDGGYPEYELPPLGVELVTRLGPIRWLRAAEFTAPDLEATMSLAPEELQRTK